MKPAYCFTDVVTPGTDYFRVGYGEATFPNALEALTAFVEEHKASWTGDAENRKRARAS